MMHGLLAKRAAAGTCDSSIMLPVLNMLGIFHPELHLGDFHSVQHAILVGLKGIAVSCVLIERSPWSGHALDFFHTMSVPMN